MKAAVTIEHIAELDMLSVKISGEFSFSKDTGLIEQVIGELKEKKCKKCLFDYSDANISITTHAIVNRSKLYEAKKMPRTLKLAGVFGTIDKHTRFLETVLVNRGWLVKNFTSREKALNWLNEQERREITSKPSNVLLKF